jgi:peroxiredoxin
MRVKRSTLWGLISLWATLSLILCFGSMQPSWAQVAQRWVIGPGSQFPDFTLDNNLSAEDSAYLGISPGGAVSIKDLKQEIVLVEFLNVYCHTCREQVPIFNELLTTVKKDPVLAAKVKILAIAIKGTPQEIIDFRKEFGVAYPVLGDPEKKAYVAIGSPIGTPQSYLIAFDEAGNRVVVDYHRGGVESPEPYLREIRRILKGELAGYDLGNKIPDVEASIGGKDVRLSEYKGRYFLLYLPALANYSSSLDLRNNAIAIKELKSIMAELKDEVMVLVLPNRLLSAGEIQKELGNQVGLLKDPNGDLRQKMGTKDDPLIILVNKTGRVSYRGTSVNLELVSGVVKGKALEPPHLEMSDAELSDRIKKGMLEVNPKLTSVEKVKLDNGEEIYVGKFPRGEREGYLFVKVVGKVTLCDVCHDTHYFYVLDEEGIIRNVHVLSATKYGNEDWDDQDIAKIRKSFVGKSVFGTFSFDPKVDAVAMATMSSSLVYEGFNEGARVFADLKKFNFRAEHWKNICYDNICLIRAAMKKAKAKSKGEWEYDPDVIAQFLPDKKLPLCPLEGIYVEYEGDILCSYHGINLRGCK